MSALPETPFGDISEEEFKSRFSSVRAIAGIFFLVILLTHVSILFFEMFLTIIGGYTYLVIFLYLPLSIEIIVQNNYVLALLFNTFIQMILLTSIVWLFVNRDYGVIEDIKENNLERGLISFSEAFLATFAISIIWFLIFPIESPFINPDEDFIFAVTVLAPIFEEISFRFVFLLFPIALVKIITKKRKSKDILREILVGTNENNRLQAIFLIISSILFGYVHVLYGWPLVKIPQAVLLGFTMGYFAIRSGILASIGLHWAINSFSIMPDFLILIGESSEGILYSISILTQTAVLAIGLLVTIVLIYRIINYRQKKQRRSENEYVV
ncbi:MAG: CPBP family glutamic-type intramembrane protease [Candidatus Njordarchaeum guaymaensis]